MILAILLPRAALTFAFIIDDDALLSLNTHILGVETTRETSRPAKK